MPPAHRGFFIFCFDIPPENINVHKNWKLVVSKFSSCQICSWCFKSLSVQTSREISLYEWLAAESKSVGSSLYDDNVLESDLNSLHVTKFKTNRFEMILLLHLGSRLWPKTPASKLPFKPQRSRLEEAEDSLIKSANIQWSAFRLNAEPWCRLDQRTRMEHHGPQISLWITEAFYLCGFGFLFFLQLAALTI